MFFKNFVTSKETKLIIHCPIQIKHHLKASEKTEERSFMVGNQNFRDEPRGPEHRGCEGPCSSAAANGESHSHSQRTDRNLLGIIINKYVCIKTHS